MPAIKVTNQATATNAVDGLKFSRINRPTRISFFASAVTATDKVSVSVDQTDYMVNANPNIESSADVCDTKRDQLLYDEPLRTGQLFVAVTATTAVNFLAVLRYMPRPVAQQ